MSSDPNHPYADYLRDIYMEIHSTFYPPPAVAIPNVNIPVPNLNYEYSFQREKETIIEYEKHTKRQALNPSSGGPKLDPNLPEARQKPKNLPFKHSEILQPSRITHTPPTTSKIEVLQPTILHTKPLNGFEEFETVTNVFDLMEIRSLDDKAELESLLRPIPSFSSQPDLPTNGTQTTNFGSNTPNISQAGPPLLTYPIGSTSSVPSSLPSYGSK